LRSREALSLYARSPATPLACAPRARSITFDPAAEEAKEQEVQILTAELTRAFNLAGGKLKRLACAWRCPLAGAAVVVVARVGMGRR
jgi:hypothetical protein